MTNHNHPPLPTPTMTDQQFDQLVEEMRAMSPDRAASLLASLAYIKTLRETQKRVRIENSTWLQCVLLGIVFGFLLGRLVH